MSWDDKLNWIVPIRRAVVTSRQTYRELMEAWDLCLRDGTHRAKLVHWYGLDPEYYPSACDAVSDWVSSLEDCETYGCALEETSTFDTRVPLWVRVWKGPRRILLEHANLAPTLEQQFLTGEVVNPDAEFLEGDVIEFPLFSFLMFCGKEAYEGLHFNGDGSPFLGNSVLNNDEEVPEDTQVLHDNMLAMRFQLIFNLGMAAFWHGSRVYQRGAGEGLLGQAGETSIYARGMMYGASLAVRIRPDRRNPQPPESHWMFGTYHWGLADGDVVPTRWSYDHVLISSQPLTPAWSCSPCTLATTFFLLNGSRSGADSVNREYQDGNLPAGMTRRITRADILGSDRPAEQTIPVNLLPRTPGGPAAGGVLQAPQQLADLNVACLFRHEQAIVRIYSPRHLLGMGAYEEPPHVGCLCAYNPATGQDYFDGSDEEIDLGRLWKFEAAGAMPGRIASGRAQRMGAGPHKWEQIEGNIVRFVKTPAETRIGGGYHGIWYRDADPRADQLEDVQRFNHFIAFDLNQGTLSDVYFPGQEYRPIVCGNNQLRALSRSGAAQNDYRDLYAERAVPFLTLQEFIDSTDYPPASQLLNAITTAETAP